LNRNEQRDTGWSALRAYSRSWWRGDVAAGITIAALVVPQSMAYSSLADVPPQVGLFAAIASIFAYFLVGTSRHLAVGPEPGTALLSAAGVSAIVGSTDVARYTALMATLALLVGLVSALAWVLRFGFIAELLARPVLVGYISGVGVTLIASQLGKLAGLSIGSQEFLERLEQFVRGLPDASVSSLVLGGTSLVALLVLRRLRPTWPQALIVVVVATAIVTAWGLQNQGVALVGTIPSGLPRAELPDVTRSDLGALALTAVGVALVGYNDNVLTARSIAARHRYRIDANRELLALAASNAASGMCGGMPVSSSASRTAVASAAGARTQVAGGIAAVGAAVIVVSARPVLERIPQPVLAAVILAAAVSIIDLAGFRSLWTLDRFEFSLALITALGVVFADVLIGVLLAVAFSVLLAFARIARPHDAALGEGAGLDGWVPIDGSPAGRPLSGLLVYRFDAPLLFANARRFHERVIHALDENPGIERWVVLDLEGIGTIDTTAVMSLGELVDELRQRGVAVVAVARASHPAHDMLLRARMLEPEGPLREFMTINAAVRAFVDSGA
jgi:sulfate permease, SulP family